MTLILMMVGAILGVGWLAFYLYEDKYTIRWWIMFIITYAIYIFVVVSILT